jgi:hypothetical protein
MPLSQVTGFRQRNFDAVQIDTANRFYSAGPAARPTGPTTSDGQDAWVAKSVGGVSAARRRQVSSVPRLYTSDQRHAIHSCAFLESVGAILASTSAGPCSFSLATEARFSGPAQVGGRSVVLDVGG